jgi:hypothetical protein
LLMQLLKQSTTTTIYVGPVLDAAGNPVTTAAVGDFRLVKNGAAATLSGATVAHDANGHYTIALTTGNTDTLGRLTIAIGNTAWAMSTHRYSVLPSSVFDALIANATNNAGGLITATGAISALAGAISTFAGGAVASVTAGVTLAANQDVRNVSGTLPPVTLAAGERTTLAAVLEAAMLNEGDATALLAAIAAKVEQFLINEGDATATIGAIAAAVRTNLATELARIDVAISTRNATAPPTVAAIRAEMDSNSTQLAKLGSPANVTLAADIAAVKTDTANAAAEVVKIPRKATAINAGAAATKTNTSVTPNQTLTEVIS